MNKTSRIEWHRLFLVESLPEPLTSASRHLQIFDNYIAGTRMRLRSVRDPQAREWTRILQQRIRVNGGGTQPMHTSEMFLNDAEFERFSVLKGSEIRKNRYFHDIDGRTAAYDVFLGRLWGLNTVRVDFEAMDELEQFVPHGKFLFEVTNDSFFDGENLIFSDFDAVQYEARRLAGL